MRSRKRLILTHKAPNRCSRPARIPVPESRVSLAVRAVLLQRNQRRQAQTQIEPLRMPPIFRGSPEARAGRRSDRHPVGNNLSALSCMSDFVNGASASCERSRSVFAQDGYRAADRFVVRRSKSARYAARKTAVLQKRRRKHAPGVTGHNGRYVLLIGTAGHRALRDGVLGCEGVAANSNFIVRAFLSRA